MQAKLLMKYFIANKLTKLFKASADLVNMCRNDDWIAMLKIITKMESHLCKLRKSLDKMVTQPSNTDPAIDPTTIGDNKYVRKGSATI